MSISLIKNTNLYNDGFTVTRFPELLSEPFQAMQQDAYSHLVPGRNTKNKLVRGIAWGIYAKDTYTWLERQTYTLPATHNPEENGETRNFVRIPNNFLTHPVTENLFHNIYDMWGFKELTHDRAYEIQLSAIRYEPTILEPSMPSPINPHQDLVDSAIVVLHRTDNLVGGLSRIYTLDNEPLYQMDLSVGEALLVRDSMIKHQVTPLMLEPSLNWYPGTRAYRDILIIRYLPVGR